jgi:glycosyltransferase involved in cell wall biosynthesis
MIEAAPRVSVIMPIFNGEAFLDEAIDSVMSQSVEHLQLLLCDDGSTDRSVSIAQEWASRYPDTVTCLHHPGRANRGAAPPATSGSRLPVVSSWPSSTPTTSGVRAS